MRLDKLLKAKHQELSWRQIRDAIEKGQVTVDGRVEKDPGLDVSGDAAIELNLNRPAQSRARASFDILHEDDDDHRRSTSRPACCRSLRVPKPASSEDTVLRRVREYMQFKLGHKTYVGMLHRLDRDTSGSLAVALSKDAHAAGRELFKHHRFERHYLALVQGIPGSADRARSRRAFPRAIAMAAASWWTMTGGARCGDRLPRARTPEGAALLELRLHTGRQHQIRLHLEKIGHPLIGERVYSRRSPVRYAKATAGRHFAGLHAKRNMLHAWTLAFPHPLTGERIAVEAPLPGRLPADDEAASGS